MKRLSKYPAMLFVCAFVLCFKLAQAQTQTTTTNDSHRGPASAEFRFEALLAQARLIRRAGFSLMPASNNGSGSTSSSMFIPMAGGPNLAVLGSGTTGRLTKWSGLTSGNSFISDTTIYESKFGLVGIGTDTPTSKLTVQGMIETTMGGYKFPDGTVQTTAAVSGLQGVFHDSTLNGNGTQGSPLGVAVPLTLSGQDSAILTVVNTRQVGGAAIKSTGATALGGGFPGQGLLAIGGGSDTALERAGPGVEAVGGDNSSSIGFGGFGVIAKGGGGGLRGIGMVALGGSTDQGNKGSGADGIDTQGGIGRGAMSNGGSGIVARGGNGEDGAAKGLAGLFDGDVEVQGNFNVTGGGTKNFKIDHPLDPENKYLYHAATESSEVLNIYTGNVTTDENGDAVVRLPDWFEAVNRDFRYQLTVVGSFAQAIVADEVRDHLFKIKSNAPQMKVSWLVTAVRSDAAIRKHPFILEENKRHNERGYYLSPSAYDQPEERGMEWARNPLLMERLKQQRLEAEQRRKPQ